MSYGTAALALYGLFHLGAAIFGAMDVMDYHLYFGPDATEWHTKHASCQP